MILPVTGSWMLEETAAELLSSPQTNALAPSALKVGRSFWANVKDVDARTASVIACAPRIVSRTSRFHAALVLVAFVRSKSYHHCCVIDSLTPSVSVPLAE